jgi:ABC-type arginine/histidine transport system permease subunit
MGDWGVLSDWRAPVVAGLLSLTVNSVAYGLGRPVGAITAVEFGAGFAAVAFGLYAWRRELREAEQATLDEF